jgi:hypothetical protein
MLFFLLILSLKATGGDSIPPDTWVRLADCPGDAEGREVPPGRAAKWGYVPPLKCFLRYGGYTPRFSNALDAFDPQAKKWTRLAGEDENYPANRPGGACETLVQFDAERKCVWIAGGMTSIPTGERGLWQYLLDSKSFKKIAGLPYDLVQRIAYDAKDGLFVAAPSPFCEGHKGETWVYSLAAGKWEAKTTPKCPQECYRGNFPMAWDEGRNKIVAVGQAADKFEAWIFDPVSFNWEEVSAPGPAARAVFALAYDAGAKMIMLFGGSDGADNEYVGSKIWNDTWYFNCESKQWVEVHTPGPPNLSSNQNGKQMAELTYRLALGYDSDRQCMTLSDPDLGVWQFRYDEKAPAGKEALANGFKPVVGAAAKNPPAEGPKEIRRKLPSDLNPRLLELPDNTLIPLKGRPIGMEISWCYDSDAGVFLKYGGCGNNSCPYWNHYGNDLGYYDPGTETYFERRVADVSGALRPGTGCTRSVIYDARHKLLWLLGGTSSGPYCPLPPEWDPKVTFAYDFAKDQIEVLSPKGTPAAESADASLTYHTYMTFDPERGVAIKPHDKITFQFDGEKALWVAKPSPDSPGPMYAYQTMAYVGSKKFILRIADKATGKTSTEKPSDALAPEQAAGKALNYWDEDKKAKLWRELALKTFAYDAGANTWTDLKPPQNPPFRSSKYGLCYDAKNDVVLLIGGEIGWNGPPCRDIWVYDVKKNTWEKLVPQLGSGVKNGPDLRETLMTGYDPRHNVVLFRAAGEMWAYRFKK